MAPLTALEHSVMESQQVRFSDGASYDTMMGTWSRSAGEIFLEWLQPAAGLDWIDVGCGSGAFTGLVVERCKPRTILGIDPSEAQLEFARSRGLESIARFELGDAMALNMGDNSVDAAVAALVVHFMPDPGRGIAEMARVVRPGGLVAAYAWDLSGGGFPYEALHEGMRGLGSPAADPPHPEAAQAGELKRLWTAAGLHLISQREIIVTRRFRDFDDYWNTATRSPRIVRVLASMLASVLDTLKDSIRSTLPQGTDGSITPTARANAIVGRVPQ